MAAPQISWANVLRQANGEKMVEAYGETMPPARARYLSLNKHMLVNHWGTLLTKAVAATRPPFRLMDLPPEVREQVIDHSLESKTIQVFLRGNAYDPMPTPLPLSVLTRAGDRTLRQEAIRSSIKRTTLEIHSGPGNARLQAWLAARTFELTSNGIKDGFDAVERFNFPYFSRFPHHRQDITANNDNKLMLKCKNLTHVTIHFASEEVYEGLNALKTVETLRQQYYLDDMLELKNLEVLKIEGCSTLFEPGDPEKGIRGLVKWFQEMFDEQVEIGARKKGVNLEIP